MLSCRKVSAFLMDLRTTKLFSFFRFMVRSSATYIYNRVYTENKEVYRVGQRQVLRVGRDPLQSLNLWNKFSVQSRTY